MIEKVPLESKEGSVLMAESLLFAKDKYVTFKHMNDYFAQLKSSLAEKVGLNEVQLALGEMQRKL